MKKNINARFVVLLAITVLVGIWRLFYNTTALPLLNFTPIGAMALFAGSYFSEKWKAYSLPLLTLFVSDVVMMYTMYPEYRSGLLYEGWYIVYGTFAFIVFIGNRIIRTVSVKNVVVASVLGAVAHWIITDFAVWIGGGLCATTGEPYTLDLSGFLMCYGNALPYLRSMLAGNLIYCTILFGTFEWMQRRYRILHVKTT